MSLVQSSPEDPIIHHSPTFENFMDMDQDTC